MEDVNCPYCDKPQEINHDDGYGYEEGKMYEQECSDCNKIFIYTTSISFYYEAEKAPCKNGEPHKWVDVQGCPSGYQSNRHQCSFCEEIDFKDKSLKYVPELDLWVKRGN